MKCHECETGIFCASNSLLFCTKCIFHMRGTSDSSPPAGVERAAPQLSGDIDTSVKEPVEEPVEGRGLCK